MQYAAETDRGQAFLTQEDTFSKPGSAAALRAVQAVRKSLWTVTD
jgi:hypothetical protein